MTASASQRSACQKKGFQLPGDPEYTAIPVELDQESPARRIASIVPWITRRVNGFIKTLSPRELGQFGQTDILQEVWVALLEKDQYFNPALGIKYTTWATLVVDQRIGMLRTRIGVVTAPRDGAQRLHSPRAKNSKCLEEIKRAMTAPKSLPANGTAQTRCDDDYGATAVAAKEGRSFAATHVRIHLQKLPLSQVELLRWKYGLGNEPERTVAEIAELKGASPEDDGFGRRVNEVAAEIARAESALKESSQLKDDTESVYTYG